MISDEELKYTLGLLSVRGIGNIKALRLLQYARTPQRIFSLSSEELLGIEGIGRAQTEAILGFSMSEKIEREVSLVHQHNLRPIPIWDEQYPPLLRQCPDAPILLFVRGEFDFTRKRPFISVVGARDMSAYGREFIGRMIAHLAPYRPVIVSGLAAGADAEAHRQALVNGLDTIAVMGNGLGTIYPSQNRALGGEIVSRGGALISEYHFEEPPMREHFPERNRIVAGMCRATVVVEAKAKSGALITADLAFDYDRDVFALPGRYTDLNSQGCNNLIRHNRAVLLNDPEQIVCELGLSLDSLPEEKSRSESQPTPDPSLKAEEKAVLEAIAKEQEAVQIDELAAKMGIPTFRLMPVLLDLEIKGLVLTLPGKYYRLTRRQTSL